MLRPFLLSRLHRHGCRSVSQLGRRGALWSNSQGYASSVDDDHPIYNCRRRHLYLVLDDWKRGFSIHKLDLDSNDGSHGGGDLPLPAPVHRQETNHGPYHWNFAAIGSKIVAAGGLDPDKHGITLTYDTETAGVSVVARLPAAHLRAPWTLAAAVGNGLYVFEPNSERDRWRSVVDTVGNGMHRLDAAGWRWSSLPSMLPFSAGGIESSVVHPEEGGGRGTLFVSVGRWDRKYDPYIAKEPKEGTVSRTSETFSYAGGGQWRRHGEWDLPFCGEGHYDGELDAWVGLHKELHYPGMTHAMDGYLCSSDVTSPEGSTAQPPDWKLCEERLFDPADAGHVGASLVYMGDNTYCLVKVEALEKFEKSRVGNKSAIRLAIFRLMYGKSGELTITKRRTDRSYLFFRFVENNKISAFWM